jgi:hypothetical protein
MASAPTPQSEGTTKTKGFQNKPQVKSDFHLKCRHCFGTRDFPPYGGISFSNTTIESLAFLIHQNRRVIQSQSCGIIVFDQITAFVREAPLTCAK